MDQILRVAGVVRQSIVDGPGLRFTVFVQGCPHRCPGCHNPQSHDFAGGTDATVASLLEEIGRNPLLKGITLSGGEPFCQPAPLAALARGARDRGLDVICYSGYTLEQLLELSLRDPPIKALLGQIDVLVDGPFLLEQRDLSLRFRGSSNQRILDLPRSLASGRGVPAHWAD